ncbi:MAG TPA: hypothetical protein VFW93_18300 [Aquabacterium sp.]|uniref:hypothetical protein n=1 Tax=Aquabacterium sp. TaxID=1872578 RepID=UPI002E310B7F|nr:hypothetical protein [Aquabacterium sp.]HEX5358160.1 hypothetical protein [Aquabacterium sp.]
MNTRVWTKMALASALLVGGVVAQAQTSSGSVGTAGQGGVGQQTRPAPVTGKVGNDPAAVALRPAAQAPAPVTSKATQVAPPANPNEPLFSSAAETPARAVAATSPSAPKPAADSAKRRLPHTDRTEGVKKPGKTSPQPHDKKVSGKPRQTAKGASKETGKDESAKGSKDAHKGKKKSDKQAGTASTVKGAHAARTESGKKTAALPGSHPAGHQKKPAKPHDKKAGSKVAVAHKATAGKHASVKADSKAARKMAQQTSPKGASKKAHQAKAEQAASHKTAHSQQAVVARSAAAKASAPAARKPAKAARTHKAAA